MIHPALSTTYDHDFQATPNLEWFPWVGVNYPSQPDGQRLLIVGESHYYSTEEDLLGKWKLKTQTRAAIKEAGVEPAFNNGWRGGNQRTFENTHHVLLGSKNIHREKFWGDVSFYNFIQRPMNYGGKPERPLRDDWMKGWSVFIAACQVMKPSHCIFIGVKASDRFNDAMRLMGITPTRPMIRREKISGDGNKNGCYPRTAQISLDGSTINLDFMLHASRINRHDCWRAFLKTSSPDIMGWIESREYRKS